MFPESGHRPLGSVGDGGEGERRRLHHPLLRPGRHHHPDEEAQGDAGALQVPDRAGDGRVGMHLGRLLRYEVTIGQPGQFGNERLNGYCGRRLCASGVREILCLKACWQSRTFRLHAPRVG